MYSIKYKKNKEGKNIGIDSLIIDAKDLEMMKYSSDINLIKLLTLLNISSHFKKLLVHIFRLNPEIIYCQNTCINSLLVPALSLGISGRKTNK